MRALLLLVATLALSGCLTTTKAVLDDQNSVAAAESAALVAFVETWEKDVPGSEGSPRELLTTGARVVEIGSQVLVEEIKDDGGADYYTVALFDGRPILCMAHHDGIEAIAARHGVTVKVHEDENAGPGTPSPVTADGTKAALYAFVMDVFKTGNLACQLPGVKAG